MFELDTLEKTISEEIEFVGRKIALGFEMELDNKVHVLIEEFGKS